MIFLKSGLFFVLTILTSALASPYGVPNSIVKEKLSAPPLGWVQDVSHKVDKAAASIKLRINLVQQDVDKFQDMVVRVGKSISGHHVDLSANKIQISTPGDKLYGKHLPQHEIDAMIAPKQQSKDLVTEWLEKEGLTDIAHFSPRADSVIIEGNVRQIERLLKTEYSSFGQSHYYHARTKAFLNSFTSNSP